MIIILITAFLVRLPLLNQSFWLDEAAQVIESARPLSQQLDIPADFQPPLFHLLLHFWMGIFGKSEVGIRLLPIGFSIVTIYFLYLLAKELLDQRTAYLSAFFLAISPYFVWYAQEARPYALSVLLGVSATYFLIKKCWWKYLISTILFLYSIYTAPLLILAHGAYVMLFEKKLFKNWLKVIFINILAFLPWTPNFWQQLNNGRNFTLTLPGWNEAVSNVWYKALPLVFAKFTLGRITIDNKILYAAIILAILCAILYLTYISYKKLQKQFQILSIFLFVPLILGFLLTLVLPILAPQRVLFLLPVFLIWLGMVVRSQKRWQLVLIGIYCGICSYSLTQYWTNPRFQREKWREAVEYVEQNQKSSTIAVFVFPEAFAPWQWYSKNIVSAIGVSPSFLVSTTELKQFSMQLTRADRIFYFHYLTDLTDPKKSTEKFISDLGFLETDKKDFPGVGFITIYDKALAGI